MTERLYYTDPYVRSFDATVRDAVPRDGRLVVFLDRTGFYPTSGGQPFDVGTLGGVPVVDVIDEDDGSIAHVLEPPASAPPLRAGDRVRGEIDWTRRFDHIQQHSGQHVLSAAFQRLFDARTVSFHLGAQTSTIDLAREASAVEIGKAERAANAIVWEDRAVTVRFADKEEAARLPLRKEPVREGTLRLIDIDGWDLSACGGTHVTRTGAIGIIAVVSWERFKGGQRIEFVCGGRALARFQAMRDTLTAGVRLLSVLPEELPASIERLQAEAREQKRASARLESELARFRADELAASAEPGRTGAMVLRSIDADAPALKSLAAAIASRRGFIVVLVSASSPALAVVARSADVAASAQQILASLVKTFGGRGGGRAELAQGGGLNGQPDAILAAARTLISTG